MSFENSICEDYITEKTWKILFFDMVPVVLGGGNYQDRLPPNSYIDVANFSSPKLLADYLKKVANDDALYDSYFEWKSSYAIDNDFHQQIACSTCAFLNRSFNKVTRVENLLDFWSPKKYCLAAEDYYFSFLNRTLPENSWILQYATSHSLKELLSLRNSSI